MYPAKTLQDITLLFDKLAHEADQTVSRAKGIEKRIAWREATTWKAAAGILKAALAKRPQGHQRNVLVVLVDDWEGNPENGFILDLQGALTVFQVTTTLAADGNTEMSISDRHGHWLETLSFPGNARLFTMRSSFPIQHLATEMCSDNCGLFARSAATDLKPAKLRKATPQ